MPAHLRLIQTDPPCCATRLDRAEPAVQIRRGAALREELGGALRRLYHMDPREQMPDEFEALLRALRDPVGDASI